MRCRSGLQLKRSALIDGVIPNARVFASGRSDLARSVTAGCSTYLPGSPVGC